MKQPWAVIRFPEGWFAVAVSTALPLDGPQGPAWAIGAGPYRTWAGAAWRAALEGALDPYAPMRAHPGAARDHIARIDQGDKL